MPSFTEPVRTLTGMPGHCAPARSAIRRRRAESTFHSPPRAAAPVGTTGVICTDVTPSCQQSSISASVSGSVSGVTTCTTRTGTSRDSMRSIPATPRAQLPGTPRLPSWVAEVAPSSETKTERPRHAASRSASASSANQPFVFSVVPTPAASSRSITARVSSQRSSGSPPVITASRTPSSIASSTIASQSASDSSGRSSW